MNKREVKIIFGTTDFQGNYVELTEDTYQHILNGHGYMADLIDEVKQVIEKPHMVVQSFKYDDTLIHSRCGYASEGMTNQWLHTSTTYQLGQGAVTSAYTSPGVKQGKPVYVKIKL